MGDRLTDIFMLLFCEKNSDGTKNLRLKGREMFQRINTRIKDKDMLKIANFLYANPDIVKLDLCYNNITDVGIETLVDEYLGLENDLLHLNLAGCDLTWKGVEKLCSISTTFKLKTLRLNGNKLGTEGGKFASMLLNDNTTIEHLDLGDSDQTIASCMYFMAVLREDVGTNNTLRVLDLSRIIPYNEHTSYNPGLLAEALGNMLQSNSTLHELHVQKCQFDGHDIELLLIGMKKNKTLLLLDLGYNRIGDHGVDLLADWLKTRPSLIGINLAGNGIHNYGARALSFSLPFSKVRLLDLAYNKIEDEGIVDILNTIKKPYVLRLFYIWGNTLGAKSHRIIERMLRSGVLEQDNLDVKLYTVDKVLYSAYYPADHYKHKYYCVMDHGCAVELRIKRNKVEPEDAKPRAKIKFKFYPRIPEVDYTIQPPGPGEDQEYYDILCACAGEGASEECMCCDCNMFDSP